MQSREALIPSVLTPFFCASKCTSNLATPTLWLQPTRSTSFTSDFGVTEAYRGPVGSIWISVIRGITMLSCDFFVAMAPGPQPFPLGDPGEDPRSVPSSRHSFVYLRFLFGSGDVRTMTTMIGICKYAGPKMPKHAKTKCSSWILNGGPSALRENN